MNPSQRRCPQACDPCDCSRDAPSPHFRAQPRISRGADTTDKLLPVAETDFVPPTVVDHTTELLKEPVRKGKVRRASSGRYTDHRPPLTDKNILLESLRKETAFAGTGSANRVYLGNPTART